MNIQPSPAKPYVHFLELIDLANEKFGGKVLATNDDFFAEKENLIKAAPPVFITDKYTEFGKWMDGWESRRKRSGGPDRESWHDWSIVQLGVAGVIHGVNVDTSFFVGNFPEFCSIEAAFSEPKTIMNKGTKWHEIVPKTRLQGGSHNVIAVGDRNPWTHLRLKIFPDGGVARLRVHGEVAQQKNGSGDKASKTPQDLAAAIHGGVVISCNDSFFGQKDNLIMPGRAATMGEGWETRRRRGPGHDWIIVRLSTSGQIKKIEVDTNHYKGNYPESCSIDGCIWPERDLSGAAFRDRTDITWVEILPKSLLKPDHQHFFEKELAAQVKGKKFDYIRLNIYPDGGISRLRVFGN